MRARIVLFVLVVMGAFASCNKSDLALPEYHKYGILDTVNFALSYYQEEGDTKSPLVVNESLIENSNVYLFNEKGDLVYHNYLLSGNLIKNLVIYRDEKYSVYVVANLGKDYLVNKESDLLKLKFFADSVSDYCSNNGAVIMSGVQKNIKIANNQLVNMPLKRLLAKVVLLCDFSRLGEGVSLDIKKVSLKNAPSDVCVFEENVATKVFNGESRQGNDLIGISTNGIPFYLFENIQGTVSGAVDNKSKAQLLDSKRAALCSYLEVDAALNSKIHCGDIKYRFFLGSENNNCNIYRNTTQTIKVNFKGNASEKENSVSVDNSALKDRVTLINLNPDNYEFSRFFGDTFTCTAEVLPATSYDKRIRWESSNSSIAQVDNSGVVKAVANGDCYIFAYSVENPSVRGVCSVKVNCTNLYVSNTDIVLYEGDSYQIEYMCAPGVNVSFTSSNSNIASVNSTGVISALLKGNAKITVSDGRTTIICNVKVEPASVRLPESRVMYFGEVCEIPFNELVPSSRLPQVSLSNTRALSIVSVSSKGVTVKAEGITSNVVLTAKHGNSESKCNISIEPLRIVFSQSSPLTFYKGFNDPVDYTVYPAHASSLKVVLNAPANNGKYYIKHLGENVFQGNEVSSSQNNIVAYFEDFPDNKFYKPYIVKPAITMDRDSLDLMSNVELSGIKDTKYELYDIFINYKCRVDVHKGADVSWSSSNYNVKVLPSGVVFLDSYTNLNGYKVAYITTKVMGDDGVCYSDQMSVSIYEEANLWVTTDEYAIGPYVVEWGELMQPFERKITPKSNKDISGAVLDFTAMFDFIDMQPQKIEFLEIPQYRPAIGEDDCVRINKRRAEEPIVGKTKLWFLVSVI